MPVPISRNGKGGCPAKNAARPQVATASIPCPGNGKPAGTAKQPDYTRLFETFGVEFSGNGSTNVQAACPWCEGDRFYVDVETGQYKCHKAKCGQQGNALTFIREMHRRALDATTDEHRRTLKRLRGWPLQTSKRFDLAWAADLGCWLLPSKSPKGTVVNLLRYWPPKGEDKGRKKNLPVLCSALFGLDALTAEASKTVFVCEGPFDAISLDQHLRDRKTRARYDLLAVPGASTFKPEWARFLTGRTVRLLYDADEAGRKGQERAAKVLRDAGVSDIAVLRWPDGTPDGYDIGDLCKTNESIVDFTLSLS